MSRNSKTPVYMIGVAAELCGLHPQTLRQYERQGLVEPSRVGAKNRLYSEEDIHRVRRIKRLTQEMGVNLAGVEIILRLLDEMEEMRSDLEKEMEDYARDIEARLQSYFANSKAPIRIDAPLVPMPQFQTRKKPDL